MTKAIAFSLLAAVAITACALAPQVGDAERVWCYDRSNAVWLARSALTLGVDESPDGSFAIFSVGGADLPVTADLTLRGHLRKWETGQPSATEGYEQDLRSWERVSPDTFVRSCLAAFASR